MMTRSVFALFLLLLAPPLGAQTRSILDSPHNLSSSGPGTVHALDEDRVCIFCHTPHSGRTNAPLWNRRDSNASYLPYDSPTLRAQPGQPTGTSKLCLSCHDGTVALGDLAAAEMPADMAGTQTMPAGHGLIGTDLRDDHPVSFAYSESLAGSAGELAAPGSWNPAMKLDAAGMLQCTTCHDPHNNEWGQFLVLPNSEASLCVQCHVLPQFATSPHATSPATWNGTGQDPWPHTEFADVATNACMNCHRSHHAPSGAVLLNDEAPEEVCLVCHDGNVAESDLRASFAKMYRHPIAETGASHVPGERPREAAGHVTCVDCHAPHRSAPFDAEPPFVPGVLAGASGLTIDGLEVAEATYEYEVCLKCHADDRARSAWTGVSRQSPTARLIDEFSPASPSAHPVIRPNPAANVPSLIAPLDETSMIYCSDCHGDDAATMPGSSAPAGPHGSNYEFLLKRGYRTSDSVSESPAAYALCYGCHDRASILANESFPGHRDHIVDERASCAVCHNAHGLDPATLGASDYLIDFDRSVVGPLPASGLLEYLPVPGDTGTCTLRCHNEDHDNRHY